MHMCLATFTEIAQLIKRPMPQNLVHIDSTQMACYSTTYSKYQFLILSISIPINSNKRGKKK